MSHSILKSILRLIFTVFAATTIVSCGSSPSDPSEDAKGTKDFVEKADSICAGYNEKFAKTEEVQTLEELAKQTAQVLDLYEEQLAQLRNIDPPSEVQDDFEEYLATLEERNETVRQAHEAAKEGDEQQVRAAFDKGQEEVAREQELAQKIGFKECSIPPEPAPQQGNDHEHEPGTPEEHEHAEP